MNTLLLPKGPEESVSNFIIIGANGSGKSHLGVWIEENQGEDINVLRISAQRALTIPKTIVVKSEEAAWNKIYYGNETEKNKGYKWEWGKPTSTLVNDYESVLSAVFARENRENKAYVKECKQLEAEEKTHNKVPKMISDLIIEVWDSVFPHRKIKLEDASIKVALPSDETTTYQANNMSDGERVAIYLIGQCLIAPTNTIVVIDEPEIHLHKAIMHRLWDEIEKRCSDKTLVYITHDLDFAASRKDATKIWVKSYQGNLTWEYSILDPNADIPDKLYFEVLGSRKPVLFVEGEKGSYDSHLYSYIYDGYNVIPCGNCYNVIAMTKAFNNEEVKKLHNNNIVGIVDRDYMTREEINAIENNNIKVLPIAEIENLYLLEGVVRAVAENQELSADDIFKSVKEFVFNEFLKEKETQICKMCERDIHHKLKGYSVGKKPTKADLGKQLKDIVDQIDTDGMYEEYENQIDQIIAEQSYDELLLLYNRKSLHKRVSPFFELATDNYPKLVLRLLKTDRGKVIIDSMRKRCPNLSEVKEL